jgi:hypothetical protein
MKTKILFFAALLLSAFTFQNCQKSEIDNQPDYGILPARFKVDVPASLTSDLSNQKSAYLSATADTAKGNDIYNNLNTFIAVGEGAGDIIEKIIGAIVVYKINKPMFVSYEGDDEQRVKNMVVVEGAEYGGKNYQYMLTITDAASENEADGGKALQIFWNPSPISGVAILKPYNIDRIKNENAPDAIFRIEYSEVATSEYDSYMTVEMDDLPMANPTVEPFSIHTLKMFVGKKGEYVDVYGNSDHPNAKFFTTSVGFNWAFVASGVDSKNIGVAEVGLPTSGLDNGSRDVLLKEYSIKTVFTNQINTWFYDTYGIHPDANDLAIYLQNADAPGFFDKDGFVQAGTSPNATYEPLVTRINALTPYNPKTLTDLTISFQ